MTNIHPLLHRADESDRERLIELINEFCVIDAHSFDLERVGHSLTPLLHNDDYGCVYIVEPSAGYVVLTWGYSLESGGREALIDEIYLRRRGEGLGAQVMAQIIHDVRARGCQVMFLETERRNTRARAFYRRMGFTEDDSIWMSLQL